MKKPRREFSFESRVTCALVFIVIVMSHLWYIGQSLHLSSTHLLSAFGIGAFIGAIIVGSGFALNYRFSGVLVGTFAFYLVVIAYIVFWMGISAKWLYQ